MFAQNLADFLEALAYAQQLVRVKAEVDADQELPAICRRAAQQGGPALLFERVRGQRLPVVGNLFGSVERICRTLELLSVEMFVDRLAQLADSTAKPNWLERITARGGETALERFAPKDGKTGPCQQVVRLGRDINLAELPFPRSWPGETARSITGGKLITEDTSTGERRLRVAPLAIVGPARLALPWNPHLPGADHLRQAERDGKKLAVAIVFGGCPLFDVLAQLPLPEAIDRIALAGALTEQSPVMVRCRTQSCKVPGEAELVIEGEIDPAATPIDAGKIATDWGGYYHAREALALEVTAITQRTTAALPVVIPGPAPNEGSAIDRIAERLVLPALQAIVPEIDDVAFPKFSGRRCAIFVALRDPYPGAARRVASAVWASPALLLAKLVVVVDAGVDVHNTSEVLRRAVQHARPSVDVFTQAGPADPFDATALADGTATKLGIDATEKRAAAAATSHELQASESIRELIERRWSEYGL